MVFALEAARQAFAAATACGSRPGEFDGHIDDPGTDAGLSIGIGLELFSMEDLIELRSPSFELPANLREGDYTARIFLTRGGRVIDEHQTVIFVQKVGLERFLYNLAHQRPLIYGILSLTIAIAAGWAASAVFRYLRG